VNRPATPRPRRPPSALIALVTAIPEPTARATMIEAAWVAMDPSRR
jgi:hypothetical protein